MTNSFEIASKKYLSNEFKENSLSHFLLREYLPKPKIAYQIWTLINFSEVNNFYFLKKTCNFFYIPSLKKIVSVVLSKRGLPKFKIELPNLN